MAVKVLIKRVVPDNKVRELIPLFKEMRNLAADQEGYISGETLRRLDKSDEFLVISMWQSSDAWMQWVATAQRRKVQSKIDALLGGKTEYEIYHYGLAEQ